MGAGVLNWVSKTEMINGQLQLILTGKTKERKQEVPRATGDECSRALGSAWGALTVKGGGRWGSVDSCGGKLASILSTQYPKMVHPHLPGGTWFECLPLAPLALHTIRTSTLSRALLAPVDALDRCLTSFQAARGLERGSWEGRATSARTW